VTRICKFFTLLTQCDSLRFNISLGVVLRLDSFEEVVKIREEEELKYYGWNRE